MRRRLLVCATLLLVMQSRYGCGEPIAERSSKALHELKAYLAEEVANRPPFSEQPFAQVPLTKEDAATARDLLWDDFKARHLAHCQQELAANKIVVDQHEMKIFVRKFGEEPEGKRSLFISMHGGGGAPAPLNDSQWENQKRLYKLEAGMYVAPRAPTNNWNLWHEPHIDRLFARLIFDMVVAEGVDPNRVYILGYSAGGDGVYQLAPRMADRWAGAAMMAGHPNESSPLGLRNTPFAIFVGGRDRGFHRNEVAFKWKEELEKLQKADPQGYPHQVTIYPDKGHWMDGKDAEAIPWLAKYQRSPVPSRVVWHQDDVVHPDFYWLSVDKERAREDDNVVAKVEGQTIELEQCDPRHITLRLSDELLDLDRPLQVVSEGRPVWEGKVTRTLGELARTIDRRRDPHLATAASLEVELGREKPL